MDLLCSVLRQVETATKSGKLSGDVQEEAEGEMRKAARVLQKEGPSVCADDWQFLTRKISQFQVARVKINARQILADTVKPPLITSPDVSTYLRHG